jgi:hypothetical protein
MNPMRPNESDLLRPWLAVAGWCLAGLAAGAFLTGCAAPVNQMLSPTPDFRTENVFRYSAALPANIKRVTVLPLACDNQRSDLRDGCETLDPILLGEVIRAKKFEVVSASPDLVRNRTGRCTWTGTEILPRDFFSALREVYGCDAVLFCQLTVFRAYAPLAVGCRMKLVDVRTRQTLWAVDDLVDAGQPAVLAGLEHYRQTQVKTPDADRESPLNQLLDLPLSYAEVKSSPTSQESWLMRNSPQRFGQYAAAQLLTTLPNR